MSEKSPQPQVSGYCPHGNLPSTCRACAKESGSYAELRPPAPRKAITELLSDKTDAFAEGARKRLEAMDETQVRQAMKEAVAYVGQDNKRTQYFLGGDFRTEDGGTRNRVVLGMDADEMLDVNPFLRYLCVKLVPREARLDREIKSHKAIQAAAEKSGGRLSVPRLVDVIDLPEKEMLGVVIERYAKGDKNGSLQTLIGSAKEAGTALRMAESVAGAIRDSFDELHSTGFIHGDINEGNVYLTDVEYKDYALPKEPGKRRPSKLRVIFNAKVHVTDFEKTTLLSPQHKGAEEVLARQEIGTVEEMVEGFTLEIDQGASLEEIIEASDENLGPDKRAAGGR